LLLILDHGVASADVSMYRYLPDGSLDTTYGVGGSTPLTAPGGNTFRLEIQAAAADGSVVLTEFSTQTAGACAAPETALSRVLPSGDPDAAFGTDGALADPGQFTERPDGRWVATGRVNPCTPVTGPLEVRYFDSEGHPQTSLGTNGADRLTGLDTFCNVNGVIDMWTGLVPPDGCSPGRRLFTPVITSQAPDRLVWFTYFDAAIEPTLNLISTNLAGVYSIGLRIS
jgi:hypothetical protein